MGRAGQRVMRGLSARGRENFRRGSLLLNPTVGGGGGAGGGAGGSGG